MRYRGRAGSDSHTELFGGYSGYTLIEVMIFIAATSFLLVIALTNIGGRQAQVQFSQGVRDLESKLNDIINDVSTGYFPTNTTLTCDATAPGRPIIGGSGAGNDGLGTDEDCLYAGKALQFSPGGDDNKVLVYSLAGRRNVSGSPVVNLDDAAPVAIYLPGTSSTDSVEEILVQNGVKIYRMFSTDAVPPLPPSSASETGIIGVLTNFEGANPANSVSEGQSVLVGGINGGKLGMSRTQAVAIIDSLESVPTNSGGLVLPNEGIVVCLNDGSSRKASITIGGGLGSRVVLDLDTYHEGCN